MDPWELSATVRYLTTGTYEPGMNGGEKRKMRRFRTMFFYHETTENGESIGRLYLLPKGESDQDLDPRNCPTVLMKNGRDPSTDEVIKEAHIDQDSHLNFEETFKRVSNSWWWPRYQEEIRDYVRRCHCNPNSTGTKFEGDERLVEPQPTRPRKKQRPSTDLGLPTMVISVKSQENKTHSPAAVTDERGGVEREDNLPFDDMSSSGSVSEKTRPEEEEEEMVDDEGGGGMVESNEQGRVTIVIPSAPSHAAESNEPNSPPDQPQSTCEQQPAMPRSTVCGECGAVITNSSNMIVHMRRHLRYRPYHCTQCQYQGYDPDDVRRHAARLHIETTDSTTSKVNYKPKVDMEAQLREMIASAKRIGGEEGEEVDYADQQQDPGSLQTPATGSTVLEQSAEATKQDFYASLASHLQNWTSTGMEANSVVVMCNVCSVLVPDSPVPLLRHLKSHFAFDGYQCPHCPTTNSSISLVTYRTIRDFEVHFQSSVHKTHPTVSKLQSTLDRSRRFLSDQITHFVEHSFPDARIKCQLCNRRIAWRRQSISDHLREHGGYYPYKCSLCQTPFVDLPALIEHIQRDHNSQSGGEGNGEVTKFQAVIRYCPDAKAESDCQSTFSKCFPLLTSDYIENLESGRSSSSTVPVLDSIQRGGHSSMASTTFNFHPPTAGADPVSSSDTAPMVTTTANRTTLRCQLCQAQISRNMSCLIAHAKVHLAYKPLKCDHCNFRHFAMSKIRRHNARVHGSKPVKVSYHPVPDIGRQIKEMKWQCFGPYGGGSPAVSAAHPTHVDEPALLEGEELKTVNGQESGKTGEKNRPLHASDILKEMIAVSNRHQPNDDPGSASKDNPTTASSSVVSSLSSLLAERMAAAYDDSLPKCRNTFNFQSREQGIDQPIGNGLGKKLCSLCNAFIANNPSSFENHACKHLDYKPFSCHYCQYQSYIRGKVTRHIQQVHSGEQVKISHKPIPGIRDKIQAVKLACFPFLASLINGEEANAKSRKETEKKDQVSPFINCQLCKVNLPNEPDAMEAHLVDVHMPSKVYCCLTCSSQTPQLWKAKQHSAGAHAPDVSKYVACPATGGEDDALKALQLLRLTCFGPYGQQFPLVELENDSEKSKLERLSSPLPVEEQEGSDTKVDEGNGEKRKDMLIFQRCRLCSQTVASRLDAIQDHVRMVHPGLLPKSANVESMEYWKVCFPVFQPAQSEGTGNGGLSKNPLWSRAVFGNADLDAKSNDFLHHQHHPVPTNSHTGGHSSGGGMLRKLICKLCSSTIADNPKSVGIHVKNHLNYKPYRCPFCRYMSCEQSKARRHIEHVHNANGDSIEIHAQENIKDRITEMKSRCFPNLGHMTLSEVYGNGDEASGATGSVSPEQQDGNAAASTSQQSSAWTASQLLQAGPTSSIFPNVTQPSTGQLSQGEAFMLANPFLPSYQCQICKMANIRLEDTNTHVQTHLATGLYQMQQQAKPIKPYQCSYCGVRFGTDEKVSSHMATAHPALPPKFVYQPEPLVDPEQLMTMKKHCFPDLIANYLNDLLIPTGSGNLNAMAASMREFLNSQQAGIGVSDEDQPPLNESASSRSLGQKSIQVDGGASGDFNLAASLARVSVLSSSKNPTPLDGRLMCQICDQAVSMNPNSLDVHVKNHLDFKPHSCPYCDYKSCIAGKVKRHLDNVHKGRPIRVDSFTKSSNTLKQVIADMRSACFPTMEGDYRSKTNLELSLTVENLRAQLKRELVVLNEADDGETGNLQVRIDDSSPDGQMFSPPLSKHGTINTSSPMGDGRSATDTPALETSLDDDLLSNCGTDTQSESGTVTGNAASSFGGNSSYGKLPCALCGALVADNPSSLGLHVRNHLDYKPFHCSLCDYKSCIQAKVKRHLRNVHKCPTDEMTYNPVANIRAQVTEMKYQCFPREADAVSTIGRTSSLLVSRDPLDRSRHLTPTGGSSTWVTGHGDTDDDGPFGKGRIDDGECPSDEEESGRNDLEQLAAIFSGLDEDGEDDASDTSNVDCQVCGGRVSGDDLSKTKHLTTHLGDYEYNCPYCEYTSFVQAEAVKHLSVNHPQQPLKVSRAAVSGHKLTAAYEKLSRQCFPASAVEGDKAENKENIICAVCDDPVSSDKLALMAHCTDHVTRTHYKCPHCPFIHVDDVRVNDHMRDNHETEDEEVALKQDPGEDVSSSNEFYRICFPTSRIAASPRIDSATIEVDGIEIEDEMDEDDDEDECFEADEPEQAYKSKAKSGAVADGPRYICKLCNSPVSMYASSVYVHVKNHMNYKPYCCSHCDYKSPVKSKVRRHILNSHKSQGATIIYTPKAGIEPEVLRWKKRCFPELAAMSTLGCEKIPCNLCQIDVADTYLSKSVHAKNHLDSKPYYCPYCKYKSCVKSEARRHIVRQHPGQDIDVQFKEGDLADPANVDAMIGRCFEMKEEEEELKEKMDETVQQLKSSPVVPNPTSTTVSGSAKRKAQTSGSGPAMKKEKKETEEQEPGQQQQQRSSVYNLRANRSSITSSSGLKGKKDSSDETVKLGPAYRDWYCYYCSYKAHSKYVVKQHCLSEHPGKPVEVSEMGRPTQS